MQAYPVVELTRLQELKSIFYTPPSKQEFAVIEASMDWEPVLRDDAPNPDDLMMTFGDPHGSGAQPIHSGRKRQLEKETYMEYKGYDIMEE